MDLVCIKRCELERQPIDDICDVLYVQCKTNGRLPMTQAKELIEHSLKYGAQPILAYKDKKGHIITEVLTDY